MHFDARGERFRQLTASEEVEHGGRALPPLAHDLPQEEERRAIDGVPAVLPAGDGVTGDPEHPREVAAAEPRHLAKESKGIAGGRRLRQELRDREVEALAVFLVDDAL